MNCWEYPLSDIEVTIATTPCNTTGLTRGNYSITIYTYPIGSLSSSLGNIFTSINVLVTWLGDLNGDYAVNSADLAMFSNAYIAYYAYGIVNSAADFNHDNMINSSDQAAMINAYHYYWSQQ